MKHCKQAITIALWLVSVTVAVDVSLVSRHNQHDKVHTSAEVSYKPLGTVTVEVDGEPPVPLDGRLKPTSTAGNLRADLRSSEPNLPSGSSHRRESAGASEVQQAQQYATANLATPQLQQPPTTTPTSQQQIAVPPAAPQVQQPTIVQATPPGNDDPMVLVKAKTEETIKRLAAKIDSLNNIIQQEDKYWSHQRAQEMQNQQASTAQNEEQAKLSAEKKAEANKWLEHIQSKLTSLSTTADQLTAQAQTSAKEVEKKIVEGEAIKDGDQHASLVKEATAEIAAIEGRLNKMQENVNGLAEPARQEASAHVAHHREQLASERPLTVREAAVRAAARDALTKLESHLDQTATEIDAFGKKEEESGAHKRKEVSASDSGESSEPSEASESSEAASSEDSGSSAEDASSGPAEEPKKKLNIPKQGRDEAADIAKRNAQKRLKDIQDKMKKLQEDMELAEEQGANKAQNEGRHPIIEELDGFKLPDRVHNYAHGSPDTQDAKHPKFRFTGLDTATHGNWRNVYGTNGGIFFGAGNDGDDVDIGDVDTIKLLSDNHYRYVWSADSNEPRALENPSTKNKRRLATGIFGSSFKPERLKFMFRLKEPVAKVSAYFLDWDLCDGRVGIEENEEVGRLFEIYGFQGEDGARHTRPDATLQSTKLYQGVWANWHVETDDVFWLELVNMFTDVASNQDAPLPGCGWVLNAIMVEPMDYRYADEQTLKEQGHVTP